MENSICIKLVYIEQLWWRWCWTIFMHIFFSHRLHSHSIQHCVMTLNTFFFSFYLFYFSPWNAVTTHSDLFSSTWADWGLEFFHISLGPKIRQLTCTAVGVLKSSVFINTTRVFLVIYSKIQIIEKSLCIFVYTWWICAHTWKKDSNL